MKVLTLLRAALGRVEWSNPEKLARALGVSTSNEEFRTVARVLGARQMAQATLTKVRPTTVIVSLGVVTDLLHALSMLALAGVNKKYRRVALIEAAMATVFVAIGLVHVARRRSQST